MLLSCVRLSIRFTMYCVLHFVRSEERDTVKLYASIRVAELELQTVSNLNEIRTSRLPYRIFIDLLLTNM